MNRKFIGAKLDPNTIVGERDGKKITLAELLKNSKGDLFKDIRIAEKCEYDLDTKSECKWEKDEEQKLEVFVFPNDYWEEKNFWKESQWKGKKYCSKHFEVLSRMTIELDEVEKEWQRGDDEVNCEWPIDRSDHGGNISRRGDEYGLKIKDRYGKWRYYCDRHFAVIEKFGKESWAQNRKNDRK